MKAIRPLFTSSVSTWRRSILLTCLAARLAVAQDFSLESAPPVVVKTVPAAGSKEVDPMLTELRVTFSKPMADGSWSWSTWGKETLPEPTGQPHYESDGKTCVLPVKLQPGRFYATWLNSENFHGFQDSTGRSAIPYLLTFATAGGSPKAATVTQAVPTSAPLNAEQKLVVEWTERQFRSFLDGRTFEGWSEPERAELEKKLIEALDGPQNREYYQAINSLGALRSTNAVEPLLRIAMDRREKDCRDRWMSTRALGMIGDQSVVPVLIHLVYHGNVNTRWWAQISLVRLTGENFGKDWQGWGNWWTARGGQPPFSPEFIRWYEDPNLSDPGKVGETLSAADRKFFDNLQKNSR